MGRAPCCSKVGLHRGPWAAREDTLLINYILAHGEGHWRSLPKRAGNSLAQFLQLAILVSTSWSLDSLLVNSHRAR